MNLIRWEPWRELEQMVNRMNRVFGPSEARGVPSAMTATDWIPAVDVEEDAEAYVIRMELPGIDKKDVKVTVKDGALSVSGRRSQEKEEKGKRFHRVERSYGTFMRSFTLPEDVDEDKIQAESKDGMLFLTMHKNPEVRPKAIDVPVA